jgi:CHASE3 domain sensor protein
MTIDVRNPKYLETVTQARKSLQDVLAKLQILFSARAELRTIIAQGNAQAGVNELIARINECTSVLNLYAEYTTAKKYELVDDDQLSSMVEEQRKFLQDLSAAEGATTGIAVNMLSEELLDNINAEYQATQSKLDSLEDELDRINNSMTVELSPTLIGVLHDLNVVV